MKAFMNNLALKILCLELTHQSELLAQFASLSIFEKNTRAQLDLRRLNGFAECLRFEHELGLPANLLYVAQKIGRELPPDQAAAWSNQFFASIRVGANVQSVIPKFAAWLLTDSTCGAIAYTTHDVQRSVVRSLASYCVATKELTCDNFSAGYDDELSAAFSDAPSHISFEIARSIVWAFLEKNAAHRASNLTAALERSAYARQSGCTSFKSSNSARTGAFNRQANKLLELLRVA
jgi:hypothetical protein